MTVAFTRVFVSFCLFVLAKVSAQAATDKNNSEGVWFSNAVDCLQQGQKCVNLLDLTVEVNELLAQMNIKPLYACLHGDDLSNRTELLRFKFHRMDTTSLLRQKVKSEIEVLSAAISEVLEQVTVQRGDSISAHLLSQAEKWSDVSRSISNFAMHCFKLTELQTKLLRQINDSLGHLTISGNASVALKKIVRYTEGVNIAAEYAMADALYVAQQVHEASVIVRAVANSTE